MIDGDSVKSAGYPPGDRLGRRWRVRAKWIGGNHMAYGVVHKFAGGTKEQYEASIAAVHPEGGGLPEGHCSMPRAHRPMAGRSSQYMTRGRAGSGSAMASSCPAWRKESPVASRLRPRRPGSRSTTRSRRSRAQSQGSCLTTGKPGGHRMRARPGDPHPSGLGEAPQAAGGTVAVHQGAPAVEQDRAVRMGADRLVDGSADCWRQRDEDGLRTFAAYAQHASGSCDGAGGEYCHERRLRAAGFCRTGA